jgi:LCP family protein required for cell wall assembly
VAAIAALVLSYAYFVSTRLARPTVWAATPAERPAPVAGVELGDPAELAELAELGGLAGVPQAGVPQSGVPDVGEPRAGQPGASEPGAVDPRGEDPPGSRRPPAYRTPAPGNARWPGAGWVTVLTMGIDQRPGSAAVSRSDTLLYVAVNARANRAVMFSIPRDLYVVIPDYGYGEIQNRINTANVFGDLYGYPGGGPALTAATVERNLGLRVDHTVRLNFTAFQGLIDEIGGVDLEIEPEAAQALGIPSGMQHLDGELAMQYVRLRKIDSDFGRVRRQQQLLLAVRARLADPQNLAEWLGRAPELYRQFEASVQSDLGLDGLIAFALLLKDIPPANLKGAAIDGCCVSDWTTPTGGMVLVPDYGRIEMMVQSLFEQAE